MNDDDPRRDPQAETASPALEARRHPRLRFPAVVILIYWTLGCIVSQLEKPYFYGFVYGMASSTLLVLLLVGWWWFNRGMRFSDKLLGFILIIGGAWAASRFAHQSINIFTLGALALPLVFTLVVGWMWLVQRRLISPNRLGFVVIVAVTWGAFTLIRNDGIDAELQSQMHWRWTPTAEELFLAQKPPATASAPQPVATATTGTNGTSPRCGRPRT
jgi:outer membrane protein assembly factor BamB